MHLVTEFDKEVRRYQREKELMEFCDHAYHTFALIRENGSFTDIRDHIIKTSPLATRLDISPNQKYAIIMAGVFDTHRQRGEVSHHYFEELFSGLREIYELKK